MKKNLKKTASKDDLHGNVPDNSKIVILLVDVINSLEFPDGKAMLKSFAKMSPPLAKLLKRARKAHVPIIYGNDNFGKWRSNLKAQIEACLAPDSLSRDLVLPLIPEPEDYYVLKPKHSAFYATPLALLLESLKAETIVLCGLSAESCILFTATDAYLREFQIILAEDCIASASLTKKKIAFSVMTETLSAKLKKSHTISFPSSKTKRTRAKDRSGS